MVELLGSEASYCKLNPPTIQLVDPLHEAWAINVECLELPCECGFAEFLRLAAAGSVGCVLVVVDVGNEASYKDACHRAGWAGVAGIRNNFVLSVGPFQGQTRQIHQTQLEDLASTLSAVRPAHFHLTQQQGAACSLQIKVFLDVLAVRLAWAAREAGVWLSELADIDGPQPSSRSPGRYPSPFQQPPHSEVSCRCSSAAEVHPQRQLQRDIDVQRRCQSSLQGKGDNCHMSVAAHLRTPRGVQLNARSANPRVGSPPPGLRKSVADVARRLGTSSSPAFATRVSKAASPLRRRSKKTDVTADEGTLNNSLRHKLEDPPFEAIVKLSELEKMTTCSKAAASRAIAASVVVEPQEQHKKRIPDTLSSQRIQHILGEASRATAASIVLEQQEQHRKRIPDTLSSQRIQHILGEEAHAKLGQLLFEVSIDVGGGRCERIQVHEGTDMLSAARDVVMKHGLPEEKSTAIARFLDRLRSEHMY